MSMRDALTKAGVQSTEKRLRKICVDAMVKHASDQHATQEAIWEACKRDRDLLYGLFEPFWRQATSGLINRVRNLIAYEDNKGTLKDAVEKKAAAVARAHRELEREELAQIRREEAAENDRHAWEFLERCAAWRATAAGNLTINKKPFWTVSVNEAALWVQKSRDEARFVELVITGLPDDGRPIEHYRRPDEIDALWTRAHQEART